MKKTIIWGTFQLAGRDWKIKIVTRKRMNVISEKAGHEFKCAGICSSRRATIYIADDLRRDSFEITLEHELEHAIAFSMGMTEHNERKIDARAHFRQQYNKTIRFVEQSE